MRAFLPVSIRSSLLLSLCAAVLCPAVFAQLQTAKKTSDSADSIVAGTFCPVMPERAALPEHSLTYKGRTIYFCCEDCKREFGNNPEKYAAGLPEQPAPEAAGHVHGPGFGGGESTATESSLSRYGIAVLAILGSLILLRRIKKRSAKQAQQQKAVSTGRFAKVLCAVLLGLFIPLLYLFHHLRNYTFDKIMIDVLHHATFHDYGVPPIPAKPPVEKRIKATFYRGNDERDPRLFNGGDYLTSTFHVSLRTESGEDLSYGDVVAGKEVFLRVGIERAPHTPDFFYDDRMMNKMFLTKEFDYFLGKDHPPDDKLGLTTLEKLQSWEALYPLGSVAGRGGEQSEGVVYICQEVYTSLKEFSAMERLLLAGSWPFGEARTERSGSRYHYALQYDLRFEDGVITADSDLWMGSLFRTRKVTLARLPISEWFSHEPIPPLPANQMDDPELLGLEDYDQQLSELGE